MNTVCTSFGRLDSSTRIPSAKQRKAGGLYWTPAFLCSFWLEPARGRLPSVVKNVTTLQLLLLLRLCMTLDTGGWDLAVFCLVFLLQIFMTPLAILVKGEFQVELLLVLGKLLFTFDRGLIMAFHALLDFIAFFPGVLAVLVHVMTAVALYLVFVLVLLVLELHRTLGVLRPELGLYFDRSWRLLLIGGSAQA